MASRRWRANEARPPARSQLHPQPGAFLSHTKTWGGRGTRNCGPRIGVPKPLFPRAAAASPQPPARRPLAARLEVLLLGPAPGWRPPRHFFQGFSPRVHGLHEDQPAEHKAMATAPHGGHTAKHDSDKARQIGEGDQRDL